MTDARFPERWLNDRRIRLLPDDAFRLFVNSLLWSVANKTDGVLYDDDLPLIPGGRPAEIGPDLLPVAGPERHLAKAGLWKRVADYWLIADFADTQSSASELDALAARRLADRERKAEERKRKASRDPSRDSHGDSAKARTGQDRPGQAVGVPKEHHGDLQATSTVDSTVDASVVGSAPLVTTQGPGDGESPEEQPIANSQDRRVHDGPFSRADDAHHDGPNHSPAPAADRNARARKPTKRAEELARRKARLAADVKAISGVGCPHCGAAVGERCTRPNLLNPRDRGQAIRLSTSHRSRFAAAGVEPPDTTRAAP